MKTVNFLSYDNFMQLTDAEKDQYVSTKCAKLKTGIKEKEYIIFRPTPTVANYLTFTAQVANSSVGFKINGSVPGVTLQYSIDNGITWNDYTFGNTISLPNIGDSVKFKGDNESFSLNQQNFVYCYMQGLVAASGDITSLLNEGGGDVELTEYCFNKLFINCASLTTAPELPSTTLANNCYQSMFYGCSSLTTAPTILPATTLATECYNKMFYTCTSLTTAPAISPTTLASNCCQEMFSSCVKLTTAPTILPATTLATNCYYGMFQKCTSLTAAPELPATTLATYCYSYMFYKCTNLNYIKAMFTTTPSGSYTNSWVKDVSATGTFVKNSAATWNVSGNSGIPTGWTVETASA